MSASLSSAELNALLAEECRTAGRVLSAMQLAHRRALYFRRLLLVHRRTKLAIDACDQSIRAGATATHVARAAVDRIETALRVVPPAWQHVRHLLEQSFFMNTALAPLPHLTPPYPHLTPPLPPFEPPLILP